jgi:hypothetical protein
MTASAFIYMHRVNQGVAAASMAGGVEIAALCAAHACPMHIACSRLPHTSIMSVAVCCVLQGCPGILVGRHPATGGVAVVVTALLQMTQLAPALPLLGHPSCLIVAMGTVHLSPAAHTAISSCKDRP